MDWMVVCVLVMFMDWVFIVFGWFCFNFRWMLLSVVVEVICGGVFKLVVLVVEVSVDLKNDELVLVLILFFVVVGLGMFYFGGGRSNGV